jgi:glycosyltransferase involved in cell wall biosynthesis
MISPSKARFLRQTPAEELVEEYSSYTRGQFTADGLPVLIAARNEQDDLPATLISLADSNVAVNPIVIENGSDDDTALVAKRHGANVLRSEQAYKLAALQLGVQTLRAARQLDQPLLFTDADTFVGKQWAERMAHKAVERDRYMSSVVCGSAIIWHGPKRAVDAIRTGNAFASDLVRLAKQARPKARGGNMAINFASNDVVDAYNALDRSLFIGEENAICDVVEQAGGTTVRSLSPATVVVTRGDRFASLKDCMGIKGDEGYETRQLLYAEYGEFTPYTS